MTARHAGIRGAFALIIGGFVLSNAIALREITTVRARNSLLVGNMLQSIELISGIARDLDHKRLLTFEHIFQTAPAEMAEVEAKLRDVDADYAARARDYEPLAVFSDERPTWDKLEAEIAAIQAPLAGALALSRANRDLEAQAAMSALKAQFDAIDDTSDALIRINRDEATHETDLMHERQAHAMIELAVITLAGTAVALLIAVSMSRVLERRDRRVQQAAAQLEERNRELDAFAGRVAHDLRGPLASVSLAGATLAEGPNQNPKALAILDRGVVRMQQLIEDLLALSRVGMQDPSARADPAAIAAAVATELGPAVAEVHGVLVAEVEPAAVSCNEGLLRQALWNLAENSVKYRRADAPLEVRISGHAIGQRYELRISDNGVGMASSDLQHVFRPFFRSEQVRSIHGTGLGLSIVKRIVDASGGTVSVESVLGHGTTFSLALPLQVAPA